MTRMIKEDRINEALDVLSVAAEDKKEELAARIARDYSALRGLFGDVRETASETASRAAWRGREALARGREKVRQATRTVDGRVHETPWRFLGVASAGFLLLGLMMGSRQSRRE